MKCLTQTLYLIPFSYKLLFSKFAFEQDSSKNIQISAFHIFKVLNFILDLCLSLVKYYTFTSTFFLSFEIKMKLK